LKNLRKSPLKKWEKKRGRVPSQPSDPLEKKPLSKEKDVKKKPRKRGESPGEKKNVYLPGKT